MKTLSFAFAALALCLSSAPAQDPAPLAPKIVCPEPTYDFGDKNSAEAVEHDYVIRNEGDLSLEIRGVHASCGCTAVKPSQDVIPPGGEATIHAKLDLRGRSGFQNKTITVQSNDPQTPNLLLQLKGTAVQPLRAQPSTLFFGRLDPQAPRNRTFDVISGVGPIQIEGVRADPPGFTVNAIPLDPPGDGATHRFEVILDASLPDGPVNGAIFIKTSLTDQPELAIPVAAYIVAPPVPEASPAPEAVPAPEATPAPEAAPEAVQEAAPAELPPPVPAP